MMDLDLILRILNTVANYATAVLLVFVLIKWRRMDRQKAAKRSEMEKAWGGPRGGGRMVGTRTPLTQKARAMQSGGVEIMTEAVRADDGPTVTGWTGGLSVPVPRIPEGFEEVPGVPDSVQPKRLVPVEDLPIRKDRPLIDRGAIAREIERERMTSEERYAYDASIRRARAEGGTDDGPAT